MEIQTVLKKPIPEKSSAVIHFDLQDEKGVGIPAASLSAFTLTLYDEATESTINSRNDQDVLNQNQVSVDSLGNGTFEMIAADNPFLGKTRTERHMAFFQWTFGLNKGGSHLIVITVRSRVKII